MNERLGKSEHNQVVAVLLPKPGLFPGQVQAGSERPRQVMLLSFVLQRAHVCVSSVRPFLGATNRRGDARWSLWVGEGVIRSSCQKAAQRTGWGDQVSQSAPDWPSVSSECPTFQEAPPSRASRWLFLLRRMITSLTLWNPDEAENQSKYYTCVGGSCLSCIDLESFLGNILVFFPSSAFNCSSPPATCRSPAFKWTVPPCKTVHSKTYF